MDQLQMVQVTYMGFFQNVVTGIRFLFILTLSQLEITIQLNLMKLQLMTFKTLIEDVMCCDMLFFWLPLDYGLELKLKEMKNQNAPPTKEPGTDRTHTKPNQKLEPVSEQAKKNPPITTEARNLITDQLKAVNGN